MKRLGPIIVTAALAGACGSSTLNQPPPASTVTFQLHNDGISTVYLFESCQIDFTITSLADPVRQIARVGACACECGQSSCGVCGPCFEGPRDVAVGSMVTEYWSTVDVTIQPTASGSCERRTALPPGAYRIDVPVYPTVADATAKMLARTASQSFTLPASGDVVDVALGLSP